MDEQCLPCVALAPERHCRWRGDVCSLSTQAVVLLKPARDDSDLSVHSFVDIVDRRVNVLDHCHRLSKICSKGVRTAHPSTGDLVYALNVRSRPGTAVKAKPFLRAASAF